MSKKSVEKPPAASADTRKSGDIEAIIDDGGEVNAVDVTSDTTLHLEAVSGETRNADDVDNARSTVELHHECGAKYDDSGDKTMIGESDGFETNKYSYTPSDIKEFQKSDENHGCLIAEGSDEEEDDLSTDSNADDEEGDVQDISSDSDADDDEDDVQDVSEKDDVQSLTQLHLAAACGDTEAVRSLLMSSANVDALDTMHNTPLHIATLYGHIDVVNLLLSKNANVNSINALGTSLHLAAAKGHLSIAQILLQSNADVNAVCERQATPLHLAADRGHAEIVQNLLKNSANVNACNNAKMTPLHLACQNGHTSIVEILLDNHAIVDVAKQSEATPFYLAAKNGHAAVSDLLLRRGVCDFLEIHSKYERPLDVAIKEGHTEVVEVILKHSFMISQKLTKDGDNFQENTKRGVIPVELLRPDGRRVSAELVWTERIMRDIRGHFPFTYAARSKDPKMVQLFLSVDHCMFSDMDMASRFSYVIAGIVYYINEALSEAIKCRMDFRKKVQLLINSSNINVNHQDNFLTTLLHDVINMCQRNENSNLISLQVQLIDDVIQLLLEKGADFNMKTANGETPLMIASEKGHCDVTQIFFDWEEKSGMKLDLDARDQHGETALIKAVKMHHVSAVQMLINHKVSVNVHDHYGFTALHSAIYEPHSNWLDLHFFCGGSRQEEAFCNRLSNEILGENHSSEISDCFCLTWRKEFGRLQNYREHKEKITRIKEEIVKLLLDNDETNVNAMDFRGNTPLDLAMKSSKRLNSATFEALKRRGAIRNFLESEDEAPMEVARVDERGRNPLHRLAIPGLSGYSNEYNSMKDVDAIEDDEERFSLRINGIHLRPENFRESATATDDKGRTPLHYAVTQDLVRVLLKLGSNVNAADMYGKTPLHYAEMDEQYALLDGADENTQDEMGRTPRELKQLRKSMTINEDKAKKLPIGKHALCASRDIEQEFNPYLLKELTKRKQVETIRIFSESLRPQKSSEESIWNLWTENDFIRLNRRLSRLKPLIQHFINRLAAGIKKRDCRFECQPTLVGSADEETKAVLSADFDFNFKLNNFSQLCDPFPHPLGPNGYFQLRRKSSGYKKSKSDGNYACFFNFDQYLLTNEVNSRFQILVAEVLKDPDFWQDEHLFEWNFIDIIKYEEPAGLCKTLQLKMINPIEDGEGGFIFVDVSVDIVACVHVEGWWSEDPLPDGINPSVKANGSTFVFHRPCFTPSKPYGVHGLFSETFARISFAPLESRIIKESSPLIKAAYVVCKVILYSHSETTYQLKTCLLFCMEALNAQSGSETRNEDEITPKPLVFWVERIMFCFTELSRNDVYPCYFMPSFKQRVAELNYSLRFKKLLRDTLAYSPVYDIYLDLCPDDTTIDIPMDQYKIRRENPYANCDPNWEQFDREEFIRKLSSRNFD